MYVQIVFHNVPFKSITFVIFTAQHVTDKKHRFFMLYIFVPVPNNSPHHILHHTPSKAPISILCCSSLLLPEVYHIIHRITLSMYVNNVSPPTLITVITLLSLCSSTSLTLTCLSTDAKLCTQILCRVYTTIIYMCLCSSSCAVAAMKSRVD